MCIVPLADHPLPTLPEDEEVRSVEPEAAEASQVEWEFGGEPEAAPAPEGAAGEEAREMEEVAEAVIPEAEPLPASPPEGTEGAPPPVAEDGDPPAKAAEEAEAPEK